MTCPYDMDPSCGLRYCLTRAEQFAFCKINEPSFAEFGPMIQRHGEFVNRSRAGESSSTEASHALETGAGSPYEVP